MFGSILQSEQEIIRATEMRQKVGRHSEVEKAALCPCCARAFVVYVDGNDNGQIY